MKVLSKKQIMEIKNSGVKINKNELVNIYYIVKTFEQYLELVRYFKNSYLWSNTGNAATRRYKEEVNSMNETITVFGEEISVRFEPYFSCKNVYVSKSLKVTEVKKILKRIQEFLYVLTFKKHKDIIEDIDKLVEVQNSVNNNDIIFKPKYYKTKIKEVA